MKDPNDSLKPPTESVHISQLPKPAIQKTLEAKPEECARLPMLAAQARDIYDAAVKELGPDLQGGSPLDLLADNLDASLGELLAAMELAEIPRSVGGASDWPQSELMGGDS